ncbi:hypothetical protein AWZ03_012909 [Drosophila navojoa]|uniref:Uncharacterized protein n=1 Tax=Drosophila navojoa TaxID=7232 RepID=A0A484AW90_DRONA|nr:hypothetical protein AWZ03_012909 [Drosophila navojoa]
MGDNRAVKQKTSSRKDDNVVAKVATYGHRNPIHIPPGFILKVPISLTCTECLREFQPKPLGALRLKEVEGQIEELSICQPCMTKNPFLFRYLVKYASRPRDKGKPLSRLQKTVKRLELMRLKLESSKSVYSETQAPDAKARTDRAIQLVTDLIMKFEDFQRKAQNNKKTNKKNKANNKKANSHKDNNNNKANNNNKTNNNKKPNKKKAKHNKKANNKKKHSNNKTKSKNKKTKNEKKSNHEKT